MLDLRASDQQACGIRFNYPPVMIMPMKRMELSMVTPLPVVSQP